MSKGKLLAALEPSPMKRPRLLRFLFSSLFVLLLVAGLVALSMAQQPTRQEKNRALLAAIKRNDARSVRRLLEAGARRQCDGYAAGHAPGWTCGETGFLRSVGSRSCGHHSRRRKEEFHSSPHETDPLQAKPSPPSRLASIMEPIPTPMMGKGTRLYLRVRVWANRGRRVAR